MKYWNVLLAFALLILVFFPTHAQSKTDRIDQLMRAFHNLGQFSGTVLVAESGQVIYRNSFGMANLSWQVQNSLDTKFMLASVSKQFTAMLILQQVSRGKLRLNGTIADYLPNYPAAIGRRITLHQLLNHTSGISDVTNLPDFDTRYAHRRLTSDELLAIFQNLPLEFEPGSKFGYSNSGYSVLAAILEAVTGKSYAQLLSEQITGPLGMAQTGYVPNEQVISRLATGYRWAPLDGYIQAAYFDNSLSLGAGGIYSSIDDLYRWDRALYGQQLLPDSLKRGMFTAYLNNYGYGFNVRKWEHPRTHDTLTFVEHGGANAGFNTLISRSIDDQNLIILLTNTNEAKLGFVRNRLRSILYELPYDLPEPDLKDLVAADLKGKGLAAAKVKYAALKKERLAEYGEQEFIYQFSQLGYSLLLSGHPAEALAIYQLNVDSFPSSSKAFDDLAEAYLLQGKTELARRYYNRAYELDTNNVRAKQMAEKISTQ
ncbi:CubicO group peptidase, beta-lactamase class C family [Dyadobacter soli]|uniref:CubicO group peptidase, beta-lactamase class C family n=1 Tax=Dyadobacter soli TaxID=659014 RepID=A0A1G7VDV4_9BACT|nr:serine hydrolase domain-containing protein [Dyadobacter soli]SDG57120.1 CubicO group peptidase, beta-lactamase class C family [Dyadobacter soli]